MNHSPSALRDISRSGNNVQSAKVTRYYEHDLERVECAVFFMIAVPDHRQE